MRIITQWPSAEDLVRPELKQLTPYRAGKPIEVVQRELGLDDVIKLASNENPYGPSIEVLNVLRAQIPEVWLYPDAGCTFLREALAGFYGVAVDQVSCGNGSDELLQVLSTVFLNPGDEVVTSENSFIRYKMAAIVSNVACKMTKMKEYRFDVHAMADVFGHRTKLVFIANPNNPTGTIITRSELEWLLERLPSRAILVMDEAYFEYVSAPEYPNAIDYVKQGAPVVAARTFSKAYGLAGMRVGYFISRSDIINQVERVRPPFNVSRLSQAAGVAALTDQDHIQMVARANREAISLFERSFEQMGLDYIPSSANFTMVDTGKDSKDVFDALLKRGIITRTGDIFGMQTWLRVSTGMPEQNRRFIDNLKEILI